MKIDKKIILLILLSIKKENKKVRKYKKYVINIPIELHGKIKVSAYSKGETMNEFILKRLRENI